MSGLSVEDIDQLLPQTQCGLCGYGGCLPYAKALLDEAAPIHLCPPGGVKTLKALGKILNQDPSPFMEEMAQKAKPTLIAVIREDECIGCTKCITACPVDAILGSAKSMHTVLASECTGCELCVAPCPVDCIDLIAIPETTSELSQKTKANLARSRFQAKAARPVDAALETPTLASDSLQEKQSYIQAAIARARARR